jgi:hypothetical protein
MSAVIYTVTVNSGKVMTVEELHDSRAWTTGGSGTETRVYVVTGSENEYDVNEAVERSAPGGTQLGFVRNTISGATPLRLDGNDSIYRVTVQYVSPTGFQGATREIPIGDARLRITSATEDVLVTVPKQVFFRETRPGRIPIPYEGIGDDGETFQGVNVPTPTFSFSYDFNIPHNIFNQSFVNKCARAAGKLNSEQFKGFLPGEVFCSGIEGTFSTDWLNRDTESSTQLTFNFKVKEAIDELILPIVADNEDPPPGSINLGRVGGWYYLDIHTATIVNPSPKKVHVEIDQVDVLLLFDYYDFNELQIPGGDIVDVNERF